jgi:hypothetical protein
MVRGEMEMTRKYRGPFRTPPTKGGIAENGT